VKYIRVGIQSTALDCLAHELYLGDNYVISKDIGIPIQHLWNEEHITPAESEEVTFKKWAVEETSHGVKTVNLL